MQLPECLFPFPVVYCAGRGPCWGAGARAESWALGVEPKPCAAGTQIAVPLSARGSCIALDTRMPLLFLAFRREATRAREALSSARDAAGGLAAACRRPRGGLLRRDAGHRASRTITPSLHAARPQVVVFYEDNYNFLSKMCLGRMRDACCEMIASARSGGARVFAAGSDASDAPDRYLAAGADAVLLGEGLAALMALVDRLANDVSLPVPRLVAGLPDVSATIDGAHVALEPGRSAARARAAEARPLASSSTSRRIAPYGAARTATSASTWPHRAVARSAATGARSRSGAIATCSVRPPTSPPKCCASNAITRPTMSGLPTTSSASAWIGSRDFAAVLAAGGGGVPFTIQLRADLVEPEHGRGAPRSGLPRGLDRRRERQPEDSRCHAQGHARRRDRAGAPAAAAPRASASVSS